MKSEDLEGWGATDTPVDGYASDGELNIPKLISQKNKEKKKAKSGGFQSMGLSAPVLKGILHKGYKLPTPIQRRTIPLILEGKDVVAMARTGSGKTAAFLVPLFEKLKVHNAKVGVRAIILSPTRELAVQTLTFAKELGKYTGLRAAVVLGGESIESQFAALHENPDVIVATPGRFAHICIEMNLQLDSVEYVVFDEADRLFEMGFKDQLNDVLLRISPLRQTVLFSATLPKMLVEFARAGLSDPTLIRLDVETKISENLKLGFFKVNSEDKISLLIHVVKNVIGEDEPTAVFVPTRYHVEFIHSMFENLGYPSTYVYSTLDPSARKINIAKFRAKKVNLLIVTDVAARGIDLPLLDNVINFDFPPKAKLFVHRVGRVARAGRSGKAYSLVSPDEMCYLLDLNMFLSGSIKLCPPPEEELGSIYPEYSDENSDRMFGKVPQDIIDDNNDCIRKLMEPSYDLRCLRKSSENAFTKYVKTRPPPSNESSRRLKEELWGKFLGYHPIFKASIDYTKETERLKLLETLRNLKPKSTVFEIKEKEEKTSQLVIAEKREKDGPKIESFNEKMKKRKAEILSKAKEQQEAQKIRAGIEESSELDVYSTFNEVVGNKRKRARKEDTTPHESTSASKKDFFIPYAPSDHYAEQGYSILSNFEKATAKASLDLNSDENLTQKRPNQPNVRWDRKLMKFKGHDQEKKIKTESGAWVPASYKKNLYSKWKMKMHPDEGNEDMEEDFSQKEEREGKKKGKKGFITINKSSYKNKIHPLMKGHKSEKIVHTKKGPLQVRTYEETVKIVKEKRKKFNFYKEHNKDKKQKKAKAAKHKQKWKGH